MGQFKSDVYGDVQMPTSFEQFIRLIHEPKGVSSRFVRMWRGQADIAWPIHSAAYRRIALTKSLPTETDVRLYEKRLLERATHRGFRNLDGKHLSDFELLARLQHHGAATRLVDATRNALVGLYFAASEYPRKTGLLLGLHTDFLGGYEGGYEGQFEYLPYAEIFEKIEQYNCPQTWEPPNVSPRVAAQHSQFLYSVVSSQKTGSLCFEESEGSYLAIAISPTMKTRAMKILSSVFDIRLLTLFPDLDGFGSANSSRISQWNSRW
jgi:hypothetical protein